MKTVSGMFQFAGLKIGMAGVIHLAPEKRTDAEEEAVRRLFEAADSLRRTEWSSEDMFVVTQEYSHRSVGPVAQRVPIPSNRGCQALVFGQFFGVEYGGSAVAASTRVLESYLRDGDSALDEINGAWAGVFWDRRSGQARFGRDAPGIQTLYMAPSDRRILFSTDLRAFRSSDWLGQVDEQAVAEFLHYLYVPAPRTMLRGVSAVLPGHVLSTRPDVRQARYATPRFVAGPAVEESEVAERLTAALPQFEEHLLAAVSDCLPPDGRVALALSGGKDSSTLAVALSKLCPERVLAFSVGSPDARFDESGDAALVARSLGLAFESYMPDARSLQSVFERFLNLQDQPVGDPAALPYFGAFANLPDDCSVILDGTGNDYYFGIPSVGKGVHRFQMRAKWQGRLPAPLWSLTLAAMAKGPPWMRDLQHYWRAPIEETFIAWNAWSASELQALLGRPVSFDGTQLWATMRNGCPERWLELLTEVVCGIWEPHAAYRKAVQFANGLGKPVRFPFTDLRLAKFVHALPLRLKVVGGTNKVLLRAYMSRTLPKEILSKPKSPFVFDLRPLLVPAFRWLDDQDARTLVRNVPGWNRQAISDVLAQFESQPSDWKWAYRLYGLALVASQFVLSAGSTLRKDTGAAAGGRV